ncbi:MAG: cobyric acid synthase [Firmicutes bacterium]|nr:cobyric acid synthase [Bacillota bacterium]
MKAKTLMIQGTCSDAGKSLLVTALCRIFADRGYKVAPFKSQNMALNSFATEEGLEIGRAQALQAEAARIKASVDMNPILLKPTDSRRAQVIVKGRVYKNLSAHDYYLEKRQLLDLVESSLNKLLDTYDLVIIEGAGSPAEVNLKEEDIANMRIAKMADAPVILVGDIDRGGVFASLIGTLELLEQDEKDRIKGFVINKFRGDISLLKAGLDFLEERTGVGVIGVIPYIHDLKLDSEDSLALDNLGCNHKGENGMLINGNAVDIAVIRLPHISNFTDVDVFAHEPGVKLRYVTPGSPIRDTDLVIIPGTKNTIEDMEVLHKKGMVKEIRELRDKGTPVIGICGGYQMLGKVLRDEYGVESGRKQIEGLGLLECETKLSREKVTVQVEAEVTGGGAILGPIAKCRIRGYEIHMGRTELYDGASKAFSIKRRGEKEDSFGDGCVSEDGLVFGTYIHGLFDNGVLRKSLLDFIKSRKGLKRDSIGIDYNLYRQSQIDYLAKKVLESVDVDFIERNILKIGGELKNRSAAL